MSARQESSADLPTRYTPQLATLVKSPPDGDEWLHEIKFDGYRFGCRIDAGKATLITRNGHDWTPRLPHLAVAAARVKAKQAMLDGEVAVVLPNGKTSFHGLQEALSHSEEGKNLQTVYFVFDLLFLDGRDTTKSGTEGRKAILRDLIEPLGPDSPVRYSDHVLGRGREFFDNARRLGLEGIVSKRRSAAYRPGRSREWLKTKVAQRQEFVICGFIDREGTTDQIGSLILGVRGAPGRRASWVYCGQVGTGFTQESGRQIHILLRQRQIEEHPFEAEPKLDSHRWSRRTTPAVPHWTRPELVCEVAFTEWTPDGTLRHPSFQGMRADKDPDDVLREE